MVKKYHSTKLFATNICHRTHYALLVDVVKGEYKVINYLTVEKPKKYIYLTNHQKYAIKK
jgi:hypothetical protein